MTSFLILGRERKCNILVLRIKVSGLSGLKDYRIIGLCFLNIDYRVIEFIQVIKVVVINCIRII